MPLEAAALATPVLNNLFIHFFGIRIRKNRILTIEFHNKLNDDTFKTKIIEKTLEGRLIDSDNSYEINPGEKSWMTVKSFRFKKSSGMIICKFNKNPKFLKIGWETYTRKKPKYFAIIERRKSVFNKHQLKNYLKNEGLDRMDHTFKLEDLDIHVSMSLSRKNPKLKFELISKKKHSVNLSRQFRQEDYELTSKYEDSSSAEYDDSSSEYSLDGICTESRHFNAARKRSGDFERLLSRRS